MVRSAKLFARWTLLCFTRWKLLGAFVWTWLLCSVAAGIGLQRINQANDAFADRGEPIALASQQADAINTLFLTRHKVIKNAYLFAADPERVERASSEVAAYDQQVFDSLTVLRSDPVLDVAEQQAIEALWLPLDGYRSASETRARAGSHQP